MPTQIATSGWATSSLDEALAELQYDEYLQIAGVLDVATLLQGEQSFAPQPPRTDLPLTI